MNKKLKQLARKSAFSYKAIDNSVFILEDLTFDAPKTKSFVDLLAGLTLNGKKTLFLMPEVNKNVVLSSRNVPKTKVMVVEDVNTYELLNADSLVLCEGSVSKLETLLSK